MGSKTDLKVTKKENKEEGRGGQDKKKKVMNQNKALCTPKRTLDLARGKAGLRHRER